MVWGVKNVFVCPFVEETNLSSDALIALRGALVTTVLLDLDSVWLLTTSMLTVNDHIVQLCF